MSANWFNKPTFTYMPPEIAKDIARVFSYGAEKHAPYGWRDDDRTVENFIDKALRHINEYQHGTIEDEETHLNPLVHAIADLIMAKDLFNIKTSKDRF